MLFFLGAAASAINCLITSIYGELKQHSKGLT